MPADGWDAIQCTRTLYYQVLFTVMYLSFIFVKPAPSFRTSVVQARTQSPKPAEPSPSRQSRRQGFTGPRVWALICGSIRPRLQALSVYTDEFSVIFIVEGLKKIFNRAISLINVNYSLNNYKRTRHAYFWNR